LSFKPGFVARPGFFSRAASGVTNGAFHDMGLGWWSLNVGTASCRTNSLPLQVTGSTRPVKLAVSRFQSLVWIQIDVTDDEIIIQCNNTQDMVATELVERGVPKNRIRLAFLPPEYQEFADMRQDNARVDSSLAALELTLSGQ
jgi:hypothetical protein